MSVHALAKGVRISPRKVALVASLVRGQSVDNALVILSHTPRQTSALAVKKIIESAKANAIHNHGYKSEGLYIQEIIVNQGPRLKRYRPIAKGSFHQYLKRSSHIKVVIDGQLRQTTKPKKETK
jgi:large subunit ribosomal protein L22